MNIRRKSPADLILAVHRLIEKTGDEDIGLIFRTEAVDGDGTDLPAVLDGLGFRGRAFFYGPMQAEEMRNLYSIANVTVNLASNEGFGITTIECLACGTPILVNMTGGLQDQVGLTKDDGSPVTLIDDENKLFNISFYLYICYTIIIILSTKKSHLEQIVHFCKRSHLGNDCS